MTHRKYFKLGKTLLESRFSYAADYIQEHYPTTRNAFKQFMYRQVRTLQSLNYRPNTDNLLKVALGVYERFSAAKRHCTMSKLKGLSLDPKHIEILHVAINRIKTLSTIPVKEAVEFTL